MFKIAFAQINPCVGDFEGNNQKIIAYIEKAQKEQADLVVFPELALLGYPPEDLLLKAHFIEKNFEYLKLIAKKSKGIMVLLGCVDKKNDMLYNSCAFLGDGEILDMYHKIYLPNYGVFDEKRYFMTGDTIPIYKCKGYRFSVSICEDLWNDHFIGFLKNKHLNFLVNLSASPFHLGKFYLREKILSSAARQLQTFIFYCNLIGGQDELIFDGTSKVFSSRGKLIHYGKRFTEDFFTFTIDTKKRYAVKTIVIKEEEEAFSALCLGISDYMRKNCFKKVIVGVSGGIDSAVVIALAQIALGKENVCGLLMPSPYTSKETFFDAQKICHNLGVQSYVLKIDDIFKSFRKSCLPFFGRDGAGKTEENIQARIRGNILMAFSNRFGYLVLNTGNKSEVSCGYCTLYGDMVGGFGILKDVSKDLVYKLAEYINQRAGEKIIPLSVIRRAPSAELKPNQKDSDTLPEYHVLDPILKLYVEENYSMEKIIKKGFDKKIVQKVIQMVDGNEYKRRQAPIGIKITSRAFGKDRRMPVVNRFRA